MRDTLNIMLRTLTCFLLVWAANTNAALNATLVPIPQLQQRVTDLTHSLSADQQQQLESKLAAFEQSKGSQIAVLIVPTTQPEAIEQFSIRVVDQWKLGREKQDDGVLLLLAKEDRKVRIEVGYGLEGAIPDVIAKRIINEVMTPYFRQGDIYGGIDRALDQIIQRINVEQLPAPESSGANAINAFWDWLPALLIGVLVVGGILRALFGNFLAGLVNGGIVGLIVWSISGTLLLALLFALIAFMFTLSGASIGHAGGYGRGGGFSGGGFSGGGGGFGGGGASGSW